jgi:hypothetical protein
LLLNSLAKPSYFHLHVKIGADWQIDCREWMRVIVFFGLGRARHSVIRDQLRTKPDGFPAPLFQQAVECFRGQ